MKRALVLAGLIVLAVCAGCGSQPTATSPVQQAAPATSSPSASPDTTATSASIPSLELVAASALPNGGTLKAGDEVKAGTYKPFLTGSHITSVQWRTEDRNGSNAVDLALRFDPSGSDSLSKWTTANVGRRVVVLVHGRVVGVATLMSPLTDGTMSLNGADFLAMRDVIDKAVVPTE